MILIVNYTLPLIELVNQILKKHDRKLWSVIYPEYYMNNFY